MRKTIRAVATEPDALQILITEERKWIFLGRLVNVSLALWIVSLLTSSLNFCYSVAFCSQSSYQPSHCLTSLSSISLLFLSRPSVSLFIHRQHLPLCLSSFHITSNCFTSALILITWSHSLTNPAASLTYIRAQPGHFSLLVKHSRLYRAAHFLCSRFLSAILHSEHEHNNNSTCSCNITVELLSAARPCWIQFGSSCMLWW